MVAKLDHMLGHKIILSIFQKVEILQSILSEHDGIKLKINYK